MHVKHTVWANSETMTTKGPRSSRRHRTLGTRNASNSRVKPPGDKSKAANASRADGVRAIVVGPFYLADGRGRWFLGGVTSRGTGLGRDLCGHRGVYVRVDEYRNWIASAMKRTSAPGS